MAGLGDGGVLVGGGCEGRVGGSEGDPDDLDSALVLGLEAEGEVGVLGGGVVVSDCEDGEVGRERSAWVRGAGRGDVSGCRDRLLGGASLRLLCVCGVCCVCV